MTKIFSVNNSYSGAGAAPNTNGDQAWFLIKELFKTAGWTVSQSSDGLTFGNSDLITTSTSGVGGMANAGTWFILKEPSGGLGGLRREFLFYRPNSTSIVSNGLGRQISLSNQGFSTTLGWNTSAVSATNPPIAFDMVTLDKTPPGSLNFTAIPQNSPLDAFALGSATATWNLHVCIDDAAPHGWYILTTTSTSGSPITSHFVCFDPLEEYSSTDTDPTVFHYYGSSDSIAALNYNAGFGGATSHAWFNYQPFSDKVDAANKIGAQSLAYRASFSFYSLTHQFFDTNPNSGYDVIVPAYLYMTVSMINGTVYKGKSSFIKFSGKARNNADTASVNSAKDYILIGTSSGGSLFALPWNGSTPNT